MVSDHKDVFSFSEEEEKHFLEGKVPGKLEFKHSITCNNVFN